MIRFTCLLLILFNFISISNVFAAKKPPVAYTQDAVDLYSRADLVIRGTVLRLDPRMTETIVTVSVQEVYKGSARDSVKVLTPWGKVKGDPEAAQFRPEDSFILYLVKGEANAAYQLLDKAHGKKAIIHENIYWNPQDPFQRMGFKEYLESLKQIQETQSGLKA